MKPRGRKPPCRSDRHKEISIEADWTQLDPIRLYRIIGADRVFRLRPPAVVSVARKDALWSCELEEPYVLGYGGSLEEAIDRFMIDFIASYDGLVGEKDEDLTQDARDWRDAFVGMVASVLPRDEAPSQAARLPT